MDTSDPGMVHLPHADFEHLLENAAERGARKALHDLGLEGEHAAADMRALRALLEAFQVAKRTIWQTTIKMLTTALIIAMVTGAALHFKLFGAKSP
jgi:hypothetical protein